MTFTPKPGFGSLFKNDRKTKDTQPDYKGSLCMEDGSTVQLGGWIKQGASGKFLSIKIGAPLPPRAETDDAATFRRNAETPLAGSPADDPFDTPF